MRSRSERHLLLHATRETKKPTELTWRDYLLLLLHIGAEIEHALMIEYLYAAYSLDEDQDSPEHTVMVERWRHDILTVAKEEMGHLLTVQNVLTLLGAPLCVDREDYPWGAPYYPFDFRLEPLSLRSLSSYVYAEMPPDAVAMVSGKDRVRMRSDTRKIRAILRKAFPGETLHHVSEVYTTIIDLIGDPERIPDSCFNASTLPHQASWDDWGRGYRAKPRQLDAEGNIPEGVTPSGNAPYVIVMQMATRTDAVAALTEVAGQGEAPHLRKDRKQEPSHFDRFLRIWREYTEHVMTKDLRRMRWHPARDVPVNPTTITKEPQDENIAYIESERARRWAGLLNVRYRMLLTYLLHALRLARTTSTTEPSVRAATMHRVFAEMYNLKTISGILVHLPFGDSSARRGGGRKKGKPAFAGPTFEMPYTLDLPLGEADCWRLHKDLLISSRHLSHMLMKGAPPGGSRYLKVLLDIDAQSIAWIDELLGTPGATHGSGA